MRQYLPQDTRCPDLNLIPATTCPTYFDIIRRTSFDVIFVGQEFPGFPPTFQVCSKLFLPHLALHPQPIGILTNVPNFLFFRYFIQQNCFRQYRPTEYDPYGLALFKPQPVVPVQPPTPRVPITSVANSPQVRVLRRSYCWLSTGIRSKTIKVAQLNSSCVLGGWLSGHHNTSCRILRCGQLPWKQAP